MPRRRPYWTTLSALLAAAVLAPIAASRAGAVELAMHRALYNMTLVSASRGSGIAGAQGTMSYSIRDACDGWSSETNVTLQLTYAESGEVNTNWSFASWESKDGRSYRFRVRHTRDGDVVEDLKGTVGRDVPNAKTTAVYLSPEDKVVPLPKGTLFPTRHLIDLIGAGEAGKAVFSRTVFDGASLDNPYEINAIIGRDRDADTDHATAAAGLISAAGLDDTTVRHVRMAFFPTGSKKPAPEFELGIAYRTDGIARSIRQDFGDFVIDLEPDSIEVLASPKC